MKKKLTVSTMALAFKLLDIQHHLRDCTEDIIAFSKFLASRLDFIKKPEMKPWDFVHAWITAIIEATFLKGTFGPQKEPSHSLKHMPLERLHAIAQMMPLFAEDLCGKEFAEVAEMCQKDGIGVTVINAKVLYNAKMGVAQDYLPLLPRHPQYCHLLPTERPTVIVKTEPFPYQIKPSPFRPPLSATDSVKAFLTDRDRMICKMLWADTTPSPAAQCHPFPPERPVIEEEAIRPVSELPNYRFGHQLMRDEDLPYLE